MAATRKTKQNQSQPDQPEALLVRSRAAGGFRRCGRAFTPAGQIIALADLSVAEIETLQQEPQLIVGPCAIDAEAE